MLKLQPHQIEAWVSKHFDYDRKVDKNGEVWLILANPFYTNDKKKFNISIDRGMCHDWRGDEFWAGEPNPKTGKLNKSFVKFVKLYKKITYSQAIAEIVGDKDAWKYIHPNNIVEEPEIKIVDVELPKSAVSLYKDPDNEINSMVINYLKNRGYTMKMIESAMLMRHNMNALWPYFEYDELVYWQSRNILNKKFEFPSTTIEQNGKVVAKLESSKSDFVYGFDDVKYNEYVIVTEAIFDKIMHDNNSVAIGGAEISDIQISKIALKKPKAVIFAGDMDKTGILTGILSNGKRVKSKLGCQVYWSLIDTDAYMNGAKDWNDLYTKCHLSMNSIKQMFEKNMTKLDERSTFRLHEIISEFKL